MISYLKKSRVALAAVGLGALLAGTTALSGTAYADRDGRGHHGDRGDRGGHWGHRGHYDRGWHGGGYYREHYRPYRSYYSPRYVYYPGYYDRYYYPAYDEY